MASAIPIRECPSRNRLRVIVCENTAEFPNQYCEGQWGPGVMQTQQILTEALQSQGGPEAVLVEKIGP